LLMERQAQPGRMPKWRFEHSTIRADRRELYSEPARSA
jgi:hypothetical protein